MRGRIKNTRIFSKYATAYFMVLMAVSGIILVASLLYSANILLQAERQNTQKNMQLAADTLEKQFQMMESIAIQIGSTEKYRPNVLRLGPSRDIVMLEDFAKYANYSPLSANYFLAYPSETKKIYKADGSTTYFDFYGSSVLGIPYGQTEEVFWQILSEKTVSFVYSESCILCVCPVRFYGYGSSYNAALCFMLTKQQIREYLEQVCAGLPGQYAIRADGEWILNDTDRETAELAGASDCMDVISTKGKLLLCAPLYLKGWQLLMARNSVIFYVCIGLCALLILLIALAMAHVTMRPLNRLIEKYMPENSKFEYNFQQLDSILGDMSRMNSDIRYQLKNHLLNLILRGEYSDGLLERWSITGIVFERLLYCVYLVTGGEDADAGKILGQELEKLKDLDVDFYVVAMENIDMTAVIVGYDSNVTHKQVTEMIRLAASGCSLESYAGRPVDSPKRLPLSMISAQTADSNRGSSSRNDVRSAFLAERMIAAAVSGSQEAMEEIVREVEAFLSNASAEGLLRKKNLYEFLQNVLSKAESQGMEVDKSEINSLVLLSDISMILSDLQKLLQGAAGTSARNQITGRDAAKLLVEYVIANAYDPDINLQGMSDRFGLSTDYISSMIKKETGFAFKEYLTMLRIAEGKRLLTEDKSLTVNDVAAKVGYRKASNFSKKFKELTGMQPSQLR